MGNIAGDSTEFRDIILQTNILENLMNAVKAEQAASPPNIETIRKSAWAFKNLCGHDGKFSSWSKIAPSIPMLKIFFDVDDMKAVLYATSTIVNLTAHPNADFAELSRLIGLLKNASYVKLTGAISALVELVSKHNLADLEANSGNPLFKDFMKKLAEMSEDSPILLFCFESVRIS